MWQRGLTLVTGPSLGGPRAFASAGDDVVVELGGPEDGARVRDALRRLDAPGVRLALISYEACVALDAKSPRKPRDPRLGPDVLVRELVEVELPAGLEGAALHPRTPRAPADGPRRRGSDARARRSPPQPGRALHVERIRRCREYLFDGVLYQANLAHRVPLEPATFDEGAAFFAQASAPCAAFVDVPGWGSVISLSPERFVTVDDRVARAYPIKGTRPRGETPDDDARLLAELCASEKDAAEHVMIVDLLRNDLGKVAVAGGVTVERLLEVLSVKNVHHLESTVAARLRPEVTTSALLEAVIPGGSITGAPKSSAVDVIHELEDGPRGLYTGVLVLQDGDRLRSSLLIRTWLRPDDGEGSLHVGGGIVVDSDPDAEWRETLDKAAAFLR